MFIYDKKNDKIEIYEMIGKSEEIKKYRKGVISRHKNDDLFYSLKTNNPKTRKEFEKFNEIFLYSISFDNYDPLDVNSYSELKLSEYRSDILERYLTGLYDGLEPINVFKVNKLQKEIVHKFLRTDGVEEKNINFHRIWEFKNLIDLPRELYLLQLLLLGKYKELQDENIRKQLSLFEVNYLKSVKLIDIKEMLETRLVSGSLEDIDNMASIGRKILSKRK